MNRTHLVGLAFCGVVALALSACAPAPKDDAKGIPLYHVTNLLLTPVSSTSVTLSWTNPTDARYSKTVIIRSTTGAPSSSSDGTQVYSGTGTSYTETIPAGTDPYYAAYATDASGNHSVLEQASADTWFTREHLLTGLASPASATVDGIVYVIGGAGSGGTGTNKVEAYDPSTDWWFTKAPMPTARAGLAATAVNGIIYAIGGGGTVAGNAAGMSTVEAYNPTTDTWSTKAAMPTARTWLASAAVNGIIYAMGGQDSSGNASSKMEAYDPATDTWSTKATMPTARVGLVAVSVNGIIYAIGGGSSGGYNSTPVATVAAYDPNSDTWSSKASMPSARNFLAAAIGYPIVYVFGGSAGTTGDLATLDAYVPAKNAWVSLSSMTTARRGLTGAAANGIVYAIGGYNNANLPSSSALINVEAYWR